MEKLSITMTDTHHKLVHEAIKAGEYASVSEVVRDAMRSWESKRRAQEAAIESLRRDIDEGVKAMEEGRVSPFDPEEIIRQGRERLNARNES